MGLGFSLRGGGGFGEAAGFRAPVLQFGGGRSGWGSGKKVAGALRLTISSKEASRANAHPAKKHRITDSPTHFLAAGDSHLAKEAATVLLQTYRK